VGKLLASWRRKASLAAHVAHSDNVLRGLSGAADGVEAHSSSARMPSPATTFFTRVSVFPLAEREAPLVASTCYAFRFVWEFLVLSCAYGARFVHNVVMLFVVSWTP
jgi:hypothetical protein